MSEPANKLNEKIDLQDDIHYRLDVMDAKLDMLNHSVNSIAHTLSLLTLEIKERNRAIDRLNTLSSTNVISNSINETIALYSIANDPFIKKLKLNDKQIVIRTCRSNSQSKKALIKRINHNENEITIYRTYNVSNPHDISKYVNNIMTTKKDLNITIHYCHLVVLKDELEDVLNAYDDVIASFKPKAISLLLNEYKLNHMVKILWF